jgi:hypothetical protein
MSRQWKAGKKDGNAPNNARLILCNVLTFLLLVAFAAVTQTEEFLFGWGEYSVPNGRLSAVAVDGMGNVHVLNSDNHRDEKCDSNGAYAEHWGSLGSADGQFNSH